MKEYERLRTAKNKTMADTPSASALIRNTGKSDSDRDFRQVEFYDSVSLTIVRRKARLPKGDSDIDHLLNRISFSFS